jgi:hypothetical protein
MSGAAKVFRPARTYNHILCIDHSQAGHNQNLKARKHGALVSQIFLLNDLGGSGVEPSN